MEPVYRLLDLLQTIAGQEAQGVAGERESRCRSGGLFARLARQAGALLNHDFQNT